MNEQTKKALRDEILNLSCNVPGGDQVFGPDEDADKAWLAGFRVGHRMARAAAAELARRASVSSPVVPTGLTPTQLDEAMELARQYAHAYFNRHTTGGDGYIPVLVRFKSALRDYLASLTVLPPAEEPAVAAPATTIEPTELRKALQQLLDAAKTVTSYGAQPGRQWGKLTVACLKAESALASPTALPDAAPTMGKPEDPYGY